MPTGLEPETNMGTVEMAKVDIHMATLFFFFPQNFVSFQIMQVHDSVLFCFTFAFAAMRDTFQVTMLLKH